MEGYWDECLALPSKLKDWDAYNDLKTQLQTYLEVFPLLHSLAAKVICFHVPTCFDIPVLFWVNFTTTQFCLCSTGVALDIADPIDPIDLSIRILNQVVAMERDEALRRPRWCGRSKSCDLL